MPVTLLYIEAVLYDAINDVLFEQRLYVQEMQIKFRNKVHPQVDDIQQIKFKGKVTNTGDDGIILLGCI